MGLLQILQSGGDIGASTLGVVGHLVKSVAVIVVLQLPEGLHGAFHIVVDNGKAVAVVIESLPSVKVQVLGIVHQIKALLEDFLTAHGRERVKVEADYQIGIIGEKGCQLVVEQFFVEVQLVELCKLKVKVGIPVIIQCGGVAGIIYRTVGLNKCRTREQIVRLVVLGDRDVEITDYPLVLLKLQGGPLAVVDELLDSLLKVVEDRDVGTLNLCMIDGNLSLQFL